MRMSTTTLSIMMSIFCSFVAGIGYYLTGQVWIYALNIALGAYHLGYVVHADLCQKYHSREALNRMMDEELDNLIARVEAEKIMRDHP